MHARKRLFTLTLLASSAFSAVAADFPHSPIPPASVSPNRRNPPNEPTSAKPAHAASRAPPPSYRVPIVRLSKHAAEERQRRDIRHAKSQSQSPIRLASAAVEELPAREVMPDASRGRAGELTTELDKYPIDLGTALRLADAQNPQVAFVRERVWQAIAQQTAANALWIPTLRTGVTYAEHDGSLQDSFGKIINTHRYSAEYGAGVAGYGAGPPMVPGLAADFHLADALFQPLAARRATEARRAASAAATNDLLLDVSRAYLGLLRAFAELAIADELQQNTNRLSELTDAYAKTGTGLRADAERMRTERTLRQNEFVRAEEAVWLASAKLVRLLHLDQRTILEPVGLELVPLEIISPDARLTDLLEMAHQSRPELIENQNLLSEAHARAQREKYAPLVPSVSLGMSYGGFGGGGGGSGSNFSGRTDFQALAYWQLRNLGVGDQAARLERLSQVRQQWHRQSALEDIVAQEVSEAYATWRSGSKQIEPAQQGTKAAKSSFDRNLERIIGGQGLPIEVLQSIQALAVARREYTRAVSEFNATQFNLQRATGQCLTDLSTSAAVGVPAPSEPAR